MDVEGIRIFQQPRVEPNQIEEYRAILFDSFPPSERGDFDAHLREIASGRRLLLVATAGDHLIGLATILPWIAAGVHLLEYLAVAREYRNQKIGARFFRHIRETFALREKADGIILEVESDDAGTEEERTLRKRRIGFYKRNGACLVACAPRFLAPNLAGGDPLHEKLMWLPLKQNTPPSGKKLIESIIGIYTLDYQRPADDPLLLQALYDLTC